MRGGRGREEREPCKRTVGESCRAHDVATMSVPKAQRLYTLECENARLKRLLAERDLELDVVKELLEKSREPAGVARGRVCTPAGSGIGCSLQETAA